MIPKIIHYCWFGGKKKPKSAEKCITSWKKYCPDYEIREWNESNYDAHKNEYTSHCYDEKKWAYLSDFVRLDVVHQFGGIYFDTDVELIKPIDEYLQYEGFFGFEDAESVNTGEGFGAAAGNNIVEAMMKPYLDGLKEYVACPVLNTEVLKLHGLALNGSRQNIEGCEILPVEYMNPYESTTGRMNITENTFSIHWYTMGAQSTCERIRAHITRPIHRAFGKDCFQSFKDKH